MKKLQARHGFSLIEMMIVLVIIVILVAILLPIIARAKDAGFRSAAMTQARQLGTAISVYTDESDNKMLPSTNYGAPTASKDRLWSTVLEPLVKGKGVFVAPGSDGKFPGGWDDRGWGTVGYNASTALDESQGCTDDDQVDQCVAFQTVVDATKLERAAVVALFAITPGGEVKSKYLGYEFSPYNGTPYPQHPQLSPPLASDRDLVKELGSAGLPAELIKPIYARYLSTGSDDGITPIVFADGHAKDYSAKQIDDPQPERVWRLR